MPFELPQLPYREDALAPHISEETLQYHHGKHHATYVSTLNELIKGTDLEKQSLEDIIRKAEPGKLFNQAAQHWNHSFYWKCMSPGGGKDPSGTLKQEIEKAFGSVDRFRGEFTGAAKSVFGSGWAWLVRGGGGKLSILKTPNAENPLIHKGVKALLTCDMWEHAYYVDYRNSRDKYLDAFWNVVNWEFAASNL
jgi:superoxide dismutase, Fe-Mn family